MQISISPLMDNVNFEPVEINSLGDIIKYTTKYNYSMGVFTDNYRKASNFIGASAIGLDVDNEDPDVHHTMDEAVDKFKDYKHVILPSKSHQKEKNGRVADRFRVILFFDDKITNKQDYRATWQTIMDYYPAIDTACKDTSRFYYPSTDVYSKNPKGKTWPIATYVAPVAEEIDIALGGDKGALSRQTMDFLINGADPGKRNAALFKAAKDMQEQGYSFEEAQVKVEGMIKVSKNWGTNYINAKDIECIQSAYAQDPMYQPRKAIQQGRSVFNFQTLDQMIDEAGEIDWLVDGLMTKGGFSLMVGPPKAGKSTLVRQIVKHVCQGGHFLGRNVSKGKVLYLTFEEQPAILKIQFNAVGITGKDPIVIHTGAVFDNRALDDLTEAIYEFGPTLVILDTLFDISQLEGINNYKEVKDSLSRIRKMARDTNAHVLGVHHTNKGGTDFNSIMGSQAIFGAVDTVVRFVQERERRYIHTTGKHGDHFRDQEIIFEPVTQTYSLGEKRTDKSGL